MSFQKIYKILINSKTVSIFRGKPGFSTFRQFAQKTDAASVPLVSAKTDWDFYEK
jgi:hypothetical protein